MIQKRLSYSKWPPLPGKNTRKINKGTKPWYQTTWPINQRLLQYNYSDNCIQTTSHDYREGVRITEFRWSRNPKL